MLLLFLQGLVQLVKYLVSLDSRTFKQSSHIIVFSQCCLEDPCIRNLQQTSIKQLTEDRFSEKLSNTVVSMILTGSEIWC